MPPVPGCDDCAAELSQEATSVWLPGTTLNYFALGIWDWRFLGIDDAFVGCRVSGILKARR